MCDNKQPYNEYEWLLFIDGSKYSLKAALLHNGMKKPSMFPKIFYMEIKEVVLLGPDIRKLMNDDNFTRCLSVTGTV